MMACGHASRSGTSGGLFLSCFVCPIPRSDRICHNGLDNEDNTHHFPQHFPVISCPIKGCHLLNVTTSRNRPLGRVGWQQMHHYRIVSPIRRIITFLTPHPHTRVNTGPSHGPQLSSNTQTLGAWLGNIGSDRPTPNPCVTRTVEPFPFFTFSFPTFFESSRLALGHAPVCTHPPQPSIASHGNQEIGNSISNSLVEPFISSRRYRTSHHVMHWGPRTEAEDTWPDFVSERGSSLGRGGDCLVWTLGPCQKLVCHYNSGKKSF